MSYFVYIMYSPTLKRFYKGQTKDIKDRIYRHNNGMEKATTAGVPWKLLWTTQKADRGEAMILERKLKNLRSG